MYSLPGELTDEQTNWNSPTTGYFFNTDPPPSNLRNGDGNDDVLKFEMSLLQLVLDVDVAAALAVVRGPAVD
jgi:hypothetical protein